MVLRRRLIAESARGVKPFLVFLAQGPENERQEMPVFAAGLGVVRLGQRDSCSLAPSS
jgi:hypothetical protein